MGCTFRKVLAAASLAAALAMAREAAAQAPVTEPGARDRSLDGHIFTPSPFLASPFSTTHLDSTTLYGTARSNGPTFNVQGQVVGGTTYSTGAFGNAVEYQYRFGDLLALRLSGTAIVFTGIDAPSALATGASFRYTFNAGLTIGHTFLPNLRLAAVFDANLTPAFDLTIAAGILRAVQTGVFSSGSVLVVGRTYQYQPGLSLAWAPHPLVGVQGEIRYVNTHVKQSSPEQTRGDAVDMVGVVDLDFQSISSVGVAVAGLYRLQKPTSGGNQFRVQDVGGGIFYTAHPHLGAGVLFTRRTFDIRPSLPTRANLFELQVRYYW